MKTLTTTAATNAPATQPKTHRLELPSHSFRRLEETATCQGFADLPAMIAHVCTAYTWPADRWQIMGEPKEFKAWNRAARAAGMLPEEWIRETLNAAAGATA